MSIPSRHFRRVVLVAGVLLSWSFRPAVATACRCLDQKTVAAAYRAADVAITARVVSVDPQPAIDGFTFRATVLDAWKASVPDEMTVTTGSDCRYDVSSGETYLLFLTKTPAGDWTTGRCMGNGPIGTKASQIKWLEAKGKKTKSAGR